MSKWDKQYNDLIERILETGVKVANRTGVDAYRIEPITLIFDLQEEFPILTTKFVAFKTAVLEMLWIWQAQSNDVNWLNERGVKIWDQWKIDSKGKLKMTAYKEKDGKLVQTEFVKDFGVEKAGTIGTAYGYIVKKYSFTDRLIDTLKRNPDDRRMVYSLYQENELDTGTLYPCVWSTEWTVVGDRLDLVVHQRSADVALGLPFNVAQYATLLSLIAQVTGYKPGKMMWSITNPHIYVNQIDGIKTQISRFKENLGAIIKNCPSLWINPEIKDFYEFENFNLDDIKLESYTHLGKISMPVAV